MDLSWDGWDRAWRLFELPIWEEEKMDIYLLTPFPYCSKEIQLSTNSSATLSILHMQLVLKSREAWFLSQKETISIYTSVCVSHSVMSDSFATPWTVAHQAPLSMGFPSQEYWSGLPFPSPGDLSHPGIEPSPPASPALAGGFFTTSTTWEGNSLENGSPKMTHQCTP